MNSKTITIGTRIIEKWATAPKPSVIRFVVPRSMDVKNHASILLIPGTGKILRHVISGLETRVVTENALSLIHISEPTRPY